MGIQYHFYTPDGVRDLLPDETFDKRNLEAELRQLYRRLGYLEIETPGIEYYDVFAPDFAPQEGLFKFFDGQGRILCLRFDGTIPTARFAATAWRDAPAPLRLFYIGQMYRFNESGGGLQREFGQAGIELLGEPDASADAEVIAAAVQSALLAGISDLQVTIGQVAFFKGLVKEWQLTEAIAKELQKIIHRKESVALNNLARQQNWRADQLDILKVVLQGNTSPEQLDAWIARFPAGKSRKALVNLREILNILADYELLSYCSVDLGLLQSLDYYSGLIFKGFTYNIGYPLFSGGRYNKVVRTFGRDLPATGFSMGIDLTLTALRRQGKLAAQPQGLTRLFYTTDLRALAFRLAKELRAGGQTVITAPLADPATAEQARAQFPEQDRVGLLLPDGSVSWLGAAGGDA